MNEKMKTAQNYILRFARADATIGVTVTLGFALLLVGVVQFVRHGGPQLDYQPVAACDLLTRDEAKEMLGKDVLGGDPKNPALSDGVATSKCSYTDMNPDKDAMLVAAIAVRSAVDDEGWERNRVEFVASTKGKSIETVKDIGDSAYFDPELGQLNVLNGREWIIFSYGTGVAPQTNSLDKVIELSQKVLLTPELPTF